jgi:hypothetical protein
MGRTKINIIGFTDIIKVTLGIGIVFLIFILLFEPFHNIPILEIIVPRAYLYETPLTLLESNITTFMVLTTFTGLVIVLYSLYKYW